MINEMLGALENALSFGDVKVIRAYPAREKPHPLTGAIISLDVDGVKVQPVCSVAAEGSVLTGRAYSAVLNLTVHTPLKNGGGECRRVADDVLERLSSLGEVGAFSCGALKTARERGAYVMTVRAAFRGAVCTGGRHGLRFVKVSGEDGLSGFFSRQAAEGVVLPGSALRLAAAYLHEKKENGEILSYRPPEGEEVGESGLEIALDFTERRVAERLRIEVEANAE